MYPPGLPQRRLRSFPHCLSDFAFESQIPGIGELQRLLGHGEYEPLRPAPIFESTFLQVTRHGEPVYLHSHDNLVIVGITATSPALLLPDIMILACSKDHAQGKEQALCAPHAACDLELTRLIPLELASLYIHDMEEQQLKLQLVNGRAYYLQLCAPQGEAHLLFARWLRLMHLLQAPLESFSRTSMGGPGSPYSWHRSHYNAMSMVLWAQGGAGGGVCT
ncbi:protein FAM71D [Alligator mississippiensis]|uniref:Protein FAM71D n=1 Tax=Alligator mississippiensis TaxID=8496 RepID=A0A151MG88_ALLMI|nr:protein FAM71D [Alligator mississippiensis]